MWVMSKTTGQLSCVTMRAEHSVLWVSWQGHTGSLQLLHKQLVQVQGWDRTHIQAGLVQGRQLWVPTHKHTFLTSTTSGSCKLTVAGVLCCRLAPNVLSNQSFRLGRIKPLSRYLRWTQGHISGGLSVHITAKLQLMTYCMQCYSNRIPAWKQACDYCFQVCSV